MNTPAENKRRLNRLRAADFTQHVQGAAEAAKTHCARGHEYNETNTYIDSKGARKCRVCNKENAKHYRDERRRAVEKVRACSTAAK